MGVLGKVARFLSGSGVGALGYRRPLLTRTLYRIQDKYYAWAVTRMTGVEADPSIICHGRPTVTVAKGGRIVLGPRVKLISRSDDNAIGVSHSVILRALSDGAVITIGAETGISGGAVCAVRSVEIGERCLFGADVIVTDTDFHPVDQLPRRYAPLHEASSAPVRIGDDVFIGTRSTVLKGVSVGAGTVVGAGSIVASNLPERCVASGVPAQKLRDLRIPE